MKRPEPLQLATLASAGMTLIGGLAIGFVLGFLAAKYLHWEWGVPVGIVVGFVGGFYSMYRQISSQL